MMMNIHVDNHGLIESENHWREVNGDASDRLLALLKQYHGEGATIGPEKSSVSQKSTRVAAPRERFWFCIESSDYVPVEHPKIQDIKVAASKYFGISTQEIDSDRRMRRVVYPRQIVMFLARAYTTRSLPEIGRRLGGRDHTTALHGVNKIQHLIKTDWTVAYDVAGVEAML